MVRYLEIFSDSNGEEQRDSSLREAEVSVYSYVSVIGERERERERERVEGRKEEREKERARRKIKRHSFA